jgi:hypothetical protein
MLMLSLSLMLLLFEKSDDGWILLPYNVKMGEE